MYKPQLKASTAVAPPNAAETARAGMYLHKVDRSAIMECVSAAIYAHFGASFAWKTFELMSPDEFARDRVSTPRLCQRTFADELTKADHHGREHDAFVLRWRVVVVPRLLESNIGC